ncbi:MAG: glutaredoxin family protein [candidate division WOR-3 bacterium]
MNFTHVAGKNQNHRVTLYALSTCSWCRKTRELLEANGIDYQFIYVDLLTGAERDEAINRVRELNPRASYPTIEIDGTVVAGFDEPRIRKLLGI